MDWCMVYMKAVNSWKRGSIANLANNFICNVLF